MVALLLMCNNLESLTACLISSLAFLLGSLCKVSSRVPSRSGRVGLLLILSPGSCAMPYLCRALLMVTSSNGLPLNRKNSKYSHCCHRFGKYSSHVFILASACLPMLVKARPCATVRIIVSRSGHLEQIENSIRVNWFH